MIEENLLKEILDDIEKCEEGQKTKDGSKELVNSLMIKYSVLDSDFKKNISVGARAISVGEKDFRRELLGIKAWLEGYIIKNTDSKKTRLQMKIINDIKKLEKHKDMSDEKLEDLHEEIVNYYHSKILDFGKNLYGYNYEHEFFHKDLLGKDSIIANFKAISSKLQAFYDAGCKNGMKHKQEPLVQATFSNQNNSNINVNVTLDIVYENAQKEIDDITTFTGEEIKEIQENLLELKNIVNNNESKRSKWDKAKAIFTFALDKGIDVALAFLPMMNFLK